MSTSFSEMMDKAIKDLAEFERDHPEVFLRATKEERRTSRIILSGYHGRGKNREEGKGGTAGTSKTAPILPKPPSRHAKDAKPFPNIDLSDAD